MSDYATELAKISRIPVTFVSVALDACSLTYGASPCTATATAKCYNTYPTCRDRANFDRTTKDYEFCTADALLPYRRGERPYIKSITYLPTEIKDSLTVNSRITVEMFDEPDGDVGIDPYLSDRTSVAGTFWKKLLARNTNWKGRIIKVYEGFVWKDPESDGIEWAGRGVYTFGQWQTQFTQKFVGQIDNITMGKGTVRIEVVDLLTSLNEIKIPAESNLEIAADVAIDAVEMTIAGDGFSALAATGYIRVEDEIIHYGAKDDVTLILSSLTRAQFGTTAATHNADASVQECRYFAPDSGFDHLKTILLTDCGIASGYVDSTGIDTQRDLDLGEDEVDFSAIISEPVSAKALFFELVELLNCRAWVGEDLKITVRRSLPNYPGRAYTVLTDAANVIEGSCSVDLNHKSRLSRMSIYWDRLAAGDEDERSSYNRVDVGIDAEAESVNEYNSIAEKTLLCRWLRFGYEADEDMKAFARRQCLRLIAQFRDPMPLIKLSLELKDSGIKTGDFVKLSTDEILNPDGSNIEEAPFLVVKREQKLHRIDVTLLRITPKHYMIIAPDSLDAVDWADATEAQREYGAICDTNNQMPSDGSDGYRIY